MFSYFINSFAAASGPLKTSQSKHPSPQESSDGTGILKYRYATGYWKGKLGSSINENYASKHHETEMI